MKRRICRCGWVLGLAVCLALTLSSRISYSAPAKSKELSAEDVKALEVEKKRETIQKAKEGFNNTSWDLVLTPSSEMNKQGYDKDTIHFNAFKFTADGMVKEGFNPTNYTVRVKGSDDNPVIIWETMQTNEESGQVAFWRGEFRSGVLRGVLSLHANDKVQTVYDYSFSGSKAVEVVPSAPDAVPAEGDLPADTVEVIGEPVQVESTPAVVEAPPAVEDEPVPVQDSKDSDTSKTGKKDRRYK